MQQGRVQLDSDWNEWLAELVRRDQSRGADTQVVDTEAGGDTPLLGGIRPRRGR